MIKAELAIAGQPYSEILLMPRSTRSRWYKTISEKEKAMAMQIVDIAGRAKMSAASIEHWKDPEFKNKLIAANSGENNPMYGRTGENNPFFGKTHTEKTKAKMKIWWTPENRTKISGKNNPSKRPETRAKISAAQTGKTRPQHSETVSGEGNPNWRGGTSFEPYCPAFNNQLKESIRNRDNRNCVLCGTGEIQNGQRLSVHHVDGDKMQGCDGKRWYLCALCTSCNARPDTVEKEFLIVTGGHGG